MTPWVYLSSFGPGIGQRSRTSRGLETHDVGRRKGPVRCRPVRRGRNHPAREPVSGRRTSPSARRAHVGRRRRRSARRYRWECRPPRPGAASSTRRTPRRHSAAAGPSRRCRRPRRSPDRLSPGHFRTTRPPARRNAASAFRWVRSGLSSTAAARRTAATQEGRRPQRVAAVVAGPDDRADPPAGDPAGVGVRVRGRSRWPARRRPDASARPRAGSPAAVLRLRGFRRPSSSAASAPIRYVVSSGRCRAFKPGDATGSPLDLPTCEIRRYLPSRDPGDGRAGGS